MKTKAKQPQVEYTDAERKRYLFRTAAEMRAILDRIDAKRKPRTTDLDDSLELILDTSEDNR